MALTDVFTHTIKGILPPDAVTVLAELLESSGNVLLNEQLVMIFGNIAGESSELRDLVLSSGMLKTLLRLVSSSSASLNMLRNGSWTLSMLCFGNDPVPDISKVSLCIPVLAALVKRDDFEVISDSCWGLSYSMTGCKMHIQTVIDSGVCPRLVELLSCRTSDKVIAGALSAVGKLVLGSDEQTQVVINCDTFLSALRDLLSHEKEQIVKNACWTISNIAAGNGDHIQSLINANVYPTILNLLDTSNIEVQREAAWTIRNGLSIPASRNQLDYFVSIGCIPTLCKLARSTDDGILRVVLRTIRTILDFGVADHYNNIQNLCGELSGFVLAVINYIRISFQILSTSKHWNHITMMKFTNMLLTSWTISSNNVKNRQRRKVCLAS